MSDIFDNYIKLCLLLRGPATQAFRALMTYYLQECGIPFRKFIDINQHEIYHLHNNQKCCQCTEPYILGNKSRTPIPIAQMEIMFNTKSQRKHNHKYSKKDMCCCYAKCQIRVDDVDITMLKILLNNFCDDFFWTRYLKIEHSGNFEQFLKNKRHELFHLWQPTVTCCKCNEHKNTHKRPEKSEINEQKFESLYTIDRTMKAVGCTLNDTCTYAVRQGISQLDIRDPKLFQTIKDRFCSPRKEINSIVETRNTFSHSTDITEEEFKKCWSTLRDNVKKIECVTESKLWTEESIDILEQKLDLKNLLQEIKTDLGTCIRNEKHSHEILQKQIEQMKREWNNLFQKSRENNPAQSFTSLSHKNYTEASICLHPKQLKLKLKKLYKEIDCGTEEAEKRLKENCHNLNLTLRNETPRDGNCFFDAVSLQLRDIGLRERSAEELRENVIDYLMMNRTFQGVDGVVNIEHFINDSTFEDWARNMRINGVFADHVVVVGMARMLETNMLIVTSNPQANPENCMTHIVGKMDYDRMPIILGHVWENNYYSLISLDATTENGGLVEWCKMQSLNHRHTPLGICTTALKKMELDTPLSNFEVTSADIYMTLKSRTITREMNIEGKGEVFAPDVREVEIPCSSSISPMSYDNGDGDSDDDLFVCGKCGKRFTTYESFVTHKTESVRCTQRKGKNKKKPTDKLGISSEQKQNMTPGELNEKRIMLKIRMQQTPGEMEPAWKHYVKQVYRTCTGNFDVGEDITVEYIEDGSLVFWTKTNSSTVENKQKFAKSMDRFMVNLFQKCSIDTEDEIKFSLSVKVVESSEDDDDEESENDGFICGRCKTTFKSFSSFTSHKRNSNLCCSKKREEQQQKDGYVDTQKRDNITWSGYVDTQKRDNITWSGYVDTQKRDNITWSGYVDTQKRDNITWSMGDSDDNPIYVARDPRKDKHFDRKQELLWNCKEKAGKVGQGKKPLVIAVIGPPGCGKSSFLNTIFAAFSNDHWSEHAKTGEFGRRGKQVTRILKSFHKKDYYKDRDEYLLPTFLDMTGFEDDDSPLNKELLNIVLCGKLEEGEALYNVIRYGKHFGVNAVKEKYFGGKYFGIIPKKEGMPDLLDYFVIENRKYLRVNRVFVVCSANPDQPLPESLFEAVTDVTNRMTDITLYGVLTHADKYNSRDEMVYRREKEFMRALGIPKNRFARIKNYCPDIDPNMTYEDTIIPSLDVPVLRLLRQVLTAEPTDQDYEHGKTKYGKYLPNLSDPGVAVIAAVIAALVSFVLFKLFVLFCVNP